VQSQWDGSAVWLATDFAVPDELKDDVVWLERIDIPQTGGVQGAG